MTSSSINPTFNLQRAESTTTAGDDRAKITDLAAQFEAMLLMQMLRDMRTTASAWSSESDADTLGLDNFRQQFDLELAGYLSKAKGLGLSQQLLSTLENIAGTASEYASRNASTSTKIVTDGITGAGRTTAASDAEGRYANARKGWNNLVLDMTDAGSGAQWRGFNTDRAGAGGDPNSTKDAWYRWTKSVGFNPAGKSKEQIEAFMRENIEDARAYGLNILDVRGDQMLIEHRDRPSGEWVDIVGNAGSDNPAEVWWHWLPQEDFIGAEAAGSGALGVALSELRAMSGGEEAAKDLLSQGLLGDELLAAAQAERLALGSGASRTRTTLAAASETGVSSTAAVAAARTAVADALSQLVDEFKLPTGPVTSAYGWRKDPLTGAMRLHKGIDVRAAFGDAVTSAASGRVVFSGTQGGYGTTVVVEHEGGVQTRYAHLAAALVNEGETVQAGDTLGRAGSSGRSTGPHLHFEVTMDGQPIDPASFGFKAATLVADSNSGGSRDAREHSNDDQN